MALNTNTIRTKVEIDTAQAQQDIVKLNGVVSDTTAEITDKIEAKNKAVKLQNQISEDAINKAEEELKLLEAIGAEQAEIEKATKKLNAEKLKATKASVSNANALKKLEAQQKKQTKDATLAADSVNALRLRLTDLNKQYNAASAEGRKTILPHLLEVKDELNDAEEAAKRFQHNVGNYPKTINIATASIKELKEELSKVEEQFEEADEAGRKQLLPMMKDLEKQLEKTGDTASGLEKVDDASGGVLKSFKALVANPIGIVLTALVGIFAALKAAVGRSGKATETFNKIGAKLTGVFNGLIAILEPIVEFLGDKLLYAIESPMEAFKDLGQVILDNVLNRFKSVLVLGDAIEELFKGNFKEAGKLAADGFIQMTTGITDATDKIVEFGEEAVKTFKETQKATEALANKERELLKIRKELEKEQLRSLRRAEEQRQIRDDISRSIDERIKANEKLGKILEGQFLRESALAQLDLEKAQQQVKATGETIENLEAVADAEIKLLEIRERITGQQSEQLTNLNALLDEQRAKNVELAEAELERYRLTSEAAAKSGEENLAIRAELLKRQLALELENDKLTKEQKLALEAQYNSDVAALNAEEEQRKFDAQLEIDEIDLERRRAKGESVLELELELLNRKMEQELSNTDLLESERTAIIERYGASEAMIREAAEDAKKAASADYTKSALKNAGEVFGMSQEVAVAEMIMAAPKAIGHSFAKAAETYPFPLSAAMGALGAAGTVIPIIKGISDIKKAKVKGAPSGGGGGGSVSASTGGGGSGAAKAPQIAAIKDVTANNAARLGQDPNLTQSSSVIASANVSGQAGNVVFSEEKHSDFKNQVQFKEDKTTF